MEKQSPVVEALKALLATRSAREMNALYALRDREGFVDELLAALSGMWSPALQAQWIRLDLNWYANDFPQLWIVIAMLTDPRDLPELLKGVRDIHLASAKAAVQHALDAMDSSGQALAVRALSAEGDGPTGNVDLAELFAQTSKFKRKALAFANLAAERGRELSIAQWKLVIDAVIGGYKKEPNCLMVLAAAIKDLAVTHPDAQTELSRFLLLLLDIEHPQAVALMFKRCGRAIADLVFGSWPLRTRKKSKLSIIVSSPRPEFLTAEHLRLPFFLAGLAQAVIADAAGEGAPARHAAAVETDEPTDQPGPVAAPQRLRVLIEFVMQSIDGSPARLALIVAIADADEPVSARIIDLLLEMVDGLDKDDAAAAALHLERILSRSGGITQRQARRLLAWTTDERHRFNVLICVLDSESPQATAKLWREALKLAQTIDGGIEVFVKAALSSTTWENPARRAPSDVVDATIELVTQRCNVATLKTLRPGLDPEVFTMLIEAIVKPGRKTPLRLFNDPTTDRVLLSWLARYAPQAWPGLHGFEPTLSSPSGLRYLIRLAHRLVSHRRGADPVWKTLLNWAAHLPAPDKPLGELTIILSLIDGNDSEWCTFAVPAAPNFTCLKDLSTRVDTREWLGYLVGLAKCDDDHVWQVMASLVVKAFTTGKMSWDGIAAIQKEHQKLIEHEKGIDWRCVLFADAAQVVPPLNGPRFCMAPNLGEFVAHFMSELKRMIHALPNNNQVNQLVRAALLPLRRRTGKPTVPPAATAELVAAVLGPQNEAATVNPDMVKALFTRLDEHEPVVVYVVNPDIKPHLLSLVKLASAQSGAAFAAMLDKAQALCDQLDMEGELAAFGYFTVELANKLDPLFLKLFRNAAYGHLLGDLRPALLLQVLAGAIVPVVLRGERGGAQAIAWCGVYRTSGNAASTALVYLGISAAPQLSAQMAEPSWPGCAGIRQALEQMLPIVAGMLHVDHVLLPADDPVLGYRAAAAQPFTGSLIGGDAWFLQSDEGGKILPSSLRSLDGNYVVLAAKKQ